MDEQQQAVIAAEDETPELSPEARKRKEDRLRKRATRAKVKEQKQAKEAAETYTSIEEWWAANRAKLTEEQLRGLEARQDAVLNLMAVMEDYVEGKFEVLDDEDRGWLAETIEEVKSDVAQYGQCCGAVLNIPRLWSGEQADFRKRLERDSEPTFSGEQLVGRANPTSVLISYGYFIAILERTYQDFSERFLIERVPVPVYSEIMKCTSCGQEQSVSKETAEQHRKVDRKYLCVLCGAAERRSAAQSNINVFAKTREDRVEPFDKWGRRLDR